MPHAQWPPLGFTPVSSVKTGRVAVFYFTLDYSLITAYDCRQKRQIAQWYVVVFFDRVVQLIQLHTLTYLTQIETTQVETIK